MLLFLTTVLILPLSLAHCPACKAPVGGQGVPVGPVAPVGPLPPRPQRPRAPGGGQAALARGEACGVYTLGSCSRGLRCLPLGGEARPLQALLEGRGVCSESNPTTRIHSAGKTPPATCLDRCGATAGRADGQPG